MTAQGTNEPSTNLFAPSATQISQNNAGRRDVSQFQLQRDVPKTASNNCTMPPLPEPRTLKYVELCVNTGKWQMSLGEIDITRVNCDRELFSLIRERYKTIRGYRTRFFLIEPARVEWVQFSLENRYSVGIHDKPLAVPPEAEVESNRYEYDPCPLKSLPPIPDNVFLHHFNDPGHHRRPNWLRRIPKKVNDSLIGHHEGDIIGWGVHIIEGPNWLAISVAVFCIVLSSGVFATAWAVCRNDISGAFAVAGWMIGVLTAAMMVCLSKWSRE